MNDVYYDIFTVQQITVTPLRDTAIIKVAEWMN